jgi:preprotein translocase subunit SecD
LKILEQRSVGPSLGADSIRQGFKAMLIGLAFVIVFMIVYYRASGFIAVFALLLNLVFLMAVLAKLGATLTLPGIAGIVLTVGMAVDANVLIFERIREELSNGKTVRAAVDSGFDRALTAIFDANVTTLIAAVVLLQYGAGPIRGFAVTLSIGIVANLFTAYFVSRLIFELATQRSGVAKLSI